LGGGALTGEAVRRLLVLTLAALLAAPGAALAWGATGHRIIGELAVRNLPKGELPAFLARRAAIADVGELSREPDRSRGAGKLHDSDRDPAHQVNLDDEGRLEGGPPLKPMPPTRADYEAALRAAGGDSWKAGYLQYAIVDRYQQLTTDFAFWRALDAAERNRAWRTHRAWFKADKARREGLILRTLGELSHFVGDGSEPLHVTIHYNGWGAYPNPAGFTTQKIHAAFEGAMVRAGVTEAMVAARMKPFRTCGCPIEARAVDFLLASDAQVAPLYEMEKAGGMAAGDPRGPAFAAERIAEGASELRDLIVEAWRASEDRAIGYKPSVRPRDVEAGKADPYDSFYSAD